MINQTCRKQHGSLWYDTIDTNFPRLLSQYETNTKFRRKILYRNTYMIVRRGHIGHPSHFFCNHSQLLKVDKAFYFGVISQVDERQVFLYNGKKWNLDWKGNCMWINTWHLLGKRYQNWRVCLLRKSSLNVHGFIFHYYWSFDCFSLYWILTKLGNNIIICK